LELGDNDAQQWNYSDHAALAVETKEPSFYSLDAPVYLQKFSKKFCPNYHLNTANKPVLCRPVKVRSDLQV
jgi:hypothetical protein